MLSVQKATYIMYYIQTLLHHAFGPRHSFENVGEENVEAEQHVIRWNIRNVE